MKIFLKRAERPYTGSFALFFKVYLLQRFPEKHSLIYCKIFLPKFVIFANIHKAKFVIWLM